MDFKKRVIYIFHTYFLCKLYLQQLCNEIIFFSHNAEMINEGIWLLSIIIIKLVNCRNAEMINTGSLLLIFLAELVNSRVRLAGTQIFRRGRRALDRHHVQPGLADERRYDATACDWHLGTRLLLEARTPSQRLRRQLVDDRRLGERRHDGGFLADGEGWPYYRYQGWAMNSRWTARGGGGFTGGCFINRCLVT